MSGGMSEAYIRSLGYEIRDGKAVKISQPKLSEKVVRISDTIGTLYRSKTEATYALRLDVLARSGHLKSYQHEAVRLRIGTGAWFLPDFRVEHNDGTVELHEVKGGFIREAARVRLHAAAQQFPEYRFVLAQYRKGQWTLTAIAR